LPLCVTGQASRAYVAISDEQFSFLKISQ
jgi:hypothetical protein